MKFGTALLAASVTLNAILVGFVLFHRSIHSPTTAGPSTPATSPAPANARSFSVEALTSSLGSGDHARLRDQLRTLGVPEPTLQTVVKACIWMPYIDKQQQIALSQKPRGRPYWKGPLKTGTESYTREQRAELRTLNNQALVEMASLFGDEAASLSGPSTADFDFLPFEKKTALAALRRDYHEMKSELHQESARFRVPSDAAKMEYLEKEERADVVALLSRDELAAFDLRFSGSAARVRRNVAHIDVSPAEYQALYELQKSKNDIWARVRASWPTEGTRPPEFEALLKENQKTYNYADNEMLRILGNERYESYRRFDDPDFQQLQYAADRFDIPLTTIHNTYAMRYSIASESQRIRDNPALAPDQKKQALQVLAAKAREQMTSSLGEEVARTYLDKNMKWLAKMERGFAVTFEPGLKTVYEAVRAPGLDTTEEE
jgi:hypothetical protein